MLNSVDLLLATIISLAHRILGEQFAPCETEMALAISQLPDALAAANR